jgi:gluconolactonase
MFVMQYRVGADGSLTEGKTLIEYPDQKTSSVPDGMKVDSAGNIWSSGPGGIRIIAPGGTVLGQLKLPETAANLAWGDDGKTAYITAFTSIYKLRMRIAGNLPVYHR